MMKTNKLNIISKSILVAGMLGVVALPAAAQNHYSNGYYNKAQHSQAQYNQAQYNQAQNKYNQAQNRYNQAQHSQNQHNNSQHSNARHNKSYESPVSYDYAPVVNVEPVYESYQVNNPVEQCYQKQVEVKKNVPYGSGNGSYTNEIIGGVVGAAVGNQVGKIGNGNRDVGTVVGAVLGATVANGIEGRVARNKAPNQAYQTVEHCETQDSYTTEQKITGYDVAYRYNGNVYHTKSNEHPGNRIRVQVIVKPV